MIQRESSLRQRHSDAAQKGFTLLEAIVAVVIVGLVVMPLLSFIGQSARQLIAAADANERSFAQQAAVAMLDPVNPSAEPQGQLPLDDDILVSWRSEPLIPPNKEPLIGGMLAGFHLAFYKVVVTVSRRETGGEWFTFDMRKTGYESVQGAGLN